jgi:large subunit ribosomal protein L18
MISRKDHKLKNKRRIRRKKSVRANIFGSAEKPRLSVFRSHKNIYCQIIDDYQRKTLASASTRSKEVVSSLDGFSGNCAAAAAVGKALAEKAVAAGVTSVQFDRSGYRYHGRVKALADAARKAGLKF